MNDREMLQSMYSQLAAHLSVPVTVPPPQPPIGPGTPPPAGNYVTGSFERKGKPDPVMLHSTQVKCYPLPNDGSATGTIASGEQSGSPQPRKIHVCISKMPGLIDPNSVNYVMSPSQISAVFVTRQFYAGTPGRGGEDIGEAGARARRWFWCPVSEGPWFVNVRYDYDEPGPKPLYFEWNNGPY